VKIRDAQRAFFLMEKATALWHSVPSQSAGGLFLLMSCPSPFCPMLVVMSLILLDFLLFISAYLIEIKPLMRIFLVFSGFCNFRCFTIDSMDFAAICFVWKTLARSPGGRLPGCC